MRIALCLLLCGAAAGQNFEAASVKPAQSGGRVRPGMRGGPGTSDPGQITYTAVTLAAMLQRAYDVKAYQVSGAEWMASERYDVAAKIPPGATREQFGAMLRNLLADRFHLALHHETREIQGFELAAGKNGPKLQAARDSDRNADPARELAAPPKTDAEGFPVLDAPGLVFMEGTRGKAVVTRLAARSQAMAALTDLLSREFRLPVLDRTGLAGKFDFRLEFAPQPPGMLPAAAPMEGLPDGPDDSAPNLITAVREQLGLRLNPRKVPVDVLVVDHAERVPREN